MAKLYIRIAEKGTLMRNGKKSAAGHMWFELRDNHGKLITSSGFSSGGKSGLGDTPIGHGHPEENDALNYEKARYTAVVNLTDSQFNTLKNFHANPTAYGFNMNYYNAATNSCVDYVYKALEKAGLNPTGHEGDMIPTNNIDNLNRILGDKIINTDGKTHKHKDHGSFKVTTVSRGEYDVTLNTFPSMRMAESHAAEFSMLVGQANNLINAMSVFGSDNVVASFANHDPYAANMPQLAVAA